ncbi:hypothetical protein C8R43DRAFT_1174151 [Mycena crocata]|nr:hypothetical protein C8R43DRAFT_1174151 [Mycena crocata]
MPQPAETQIRLENIIALLAGPLNCLRILAESFQTPILGLISSTAESLAIALESVRQNKDDCVYLVEKTYSLLYAIISLFAKSESSSDLPLSVLDNLAKFIETLHKIHTYVEAQQNKSKIKHFFRQGEMNALLKDCKIGLQAALDAFKVENVDELSGLADMKKYAEKKHNEILELIETMSAGSTSEKASLISTAFSNFDGSSNSISMLPSEPKIFHGRELELSHILNTLGQGELRVAILACDSISTKAELASLIGVQRPELTLRSSCPCLLMLNISD